MKKLIEKEEQKLTKKERKALDDLGWVGKGTLHPGHIIESKKDKEGKRRKGELAADIRKGVYD